MKPPDSRIPKGLNLFQSILNYKGLSPREKERNRIAQEAFVILVAGGETTAQVLTRATYHLLASEISTLRRLKAELKTVMIDPDTQVSVHTLEQLPWLVSHNL